MMKAMLDITQSRLNSEFLPADFREIESTGEPEIAVSVRGLRQRYGQLEAVRGIDLEIAQGEIFGLIGPDGAGKTSVFHVLGGVMQATEGEAHIFGQTSREARSSNRDSSHRLGLLSALVS